MLLTSLLLVEFVEELYTLQGERPAAIIRHGRRSCAATCQITREGGAIIDTCTVVFGFLVPLLLFHCMPADRHSDSTPDSRRVRLYSRLPCGSYGAGSPTAVGCSRELVSCGDG